MEMNYRCTEASSALHDIHEAEIAQLRTIITEQQARIAQLEEALKEVKNCMANVSVDSRWFDRGMAVINEVIGS